MNLCFKHALWKKWILITYILVSLSPVGQHGQAEVVSHRLFFSCSLGRFRASLLVLQTIYFGTSDMGQSNREI